MAVDIPDSITATFKPNGVYPMKLNAMNIKSGATTNRINAIYKESPKCSLIPLNSRVKPKDNMVMKLSIFK